MRCIPTLISDKSCHEVYGLFISRCAVSSRIVFRLPYEFDSVVLVYIFTFFVCSRVHRMKQYVVLHFCTIVIRWARRLPKVFFLLLYAHQAVLAHCLLFCAILLVESITARCSKCLTSCKDLGIRLLGTLLQDFPRLLMFFFVLPSPQTARFRVRRVSI